MRRARFVAASDESGGSDRPPLVLTCIAGRAESMKIVARDLATLRAGYDIEELKWVRTRTRRPALELSRLWLDRIKSAQEDGQVAVTLVVDAAAGTVDAERWLRLYRRCLRSAVSRWPSGEWKYQPDRRTGIDWNSLRLDMNRRLKKIYTARSIRFESIQAQQAAANVMVQAADLLAGLAHLRYEKKRQPGVNLPGSKAEKNRRELLAAMNFKVLRLDRRAKR